MLSIGQTFPGAAMTVSKKLRWALFAFAAAALGGCYQPNHAALVTAVGSRVSVGMALTQAVATLQSDGFDCSEHDPVTCARTRQRLFPSSCIERVNLYSQGHAGPVTKIEVPPIACAGL